MSISRASLITVAVTGSLAVAAAAALLPLARASWSYPLSSRAAAYTLGIQFGLTADHVQQIWEGGTPAIQFRARGRDMNNKYVWQEGKLVRIGDCLDLIDKKTGTPRERAPECAQGDTIEVSGMRMHFKVRDDRAITIKTSTKAPEDGFRVAQGALFGTEGQVGFGLNFDYATFFKISFEAEELDPEDVKPERSSSDPAPAIASDVEGCEEPRLVRLRKYALLSLLPPVPARLCRYASKDGRILAMVYYRSGPLQHARFTDTLMCEALLAELLTITAKTDAAGCLGGRWNERIKPALNLVLFDATPRTYLAMFR
jgi:hypothetical protein